MCGIAGIVHRRGAPERSLLERMAGALAHRGPDARAVVVRGKVGLAHTRLAIVGLGESGAQPCDSLDGRWTLAFNGEIFNHLELRARLPDCPYKGTGDNETLVHWLASEGLGSMAELNGFFAFAAIDHQAGKLHLVRDRYGVKPLYVAAADDQVVFASEVGAFAEAGIEPELDEPIFRHHVARLWSNGPETCLRGIRKVGQGSVVTIDLETLGIEENEWFPLGALADPERSRELAAMPRDAGIDLLEETLNAAVGRRLASEVPVATLCSGGIDSSLVTAMIARQRPGMPAYVLTVPGYPQWDELPYAKAAVDHFGGELVEVPVTGEAWRAELVGSIAHFGFPFWIESGIGLGLLAARARADGFPVMLGGEGADETFGGYDYKHASERAAAHAELGLEAPELTFDATTWPIDPSIDKLLRIDDDVASHTAYNASQFERALEGFGHLGGATAEMTAAFVSQLRVFLQPSMFKLDSATMRHSLEMREPFLDNAVVELGVNMPLGWLHAPKAKGILRDVAKRYLPEVLLTRSKIGFSLDPAPFLLGHARPEFLRDGMLREVLGINKDWKLIKFLEDGENRGRAVCRILCAEIWLRRFLGRQTISAIEAELWS